MPGSDSRGSTLQDSPLRPRRRLERRWLALLAIVIVGVIGAAALGAYALTRPRTSLPAPTPTATPGPAVKGIYGPALNVDTKANLQVGWTDRARLAHRFRASATATITSVRFAQRGGSVYSGGTGGSLLVSIQSDANGLPSGTVLGSTTYTPGNPSGSWAKFDAVTLSAPVTKGRLYHVVFENMDTDPASSYISVNELFVYGPTLSPRQPALPDADYAVLYAAPVDWAVQDNFTADMDVAYSDGSHDGVAYIQNMTQYYATVSGPAAAREHFTVVGNARIVSSAAVRVRRSSGTDPLRLSVLEGDTVLASAVVAASDVPISAAGGDDGGSVWASVTFPEMTLSAGTTYDLVLTTAPTSTYTVAPIREGTDIGMESFAFREGTGQRSADGISWSDLFDKSPVDLQFYFR
jgi:hypothetical protein